MDGKDHVLSQADALTKNGLRVGCTAYVLGRLVAHPMCFVVIGQE